MNWVISDLLNGWLGKLTWGALFSTEKCIITQWIIQTIENFMLFLSHTQVPK